MIVWKWTVTTTKTTTRSKSIKRIVKCYYQEHLHPIILNLINIINILLVRQKTDIPPLLHSQARALMPLAAPPSLIRWMLLQLQLQVQLQMLLLVVSFIRHKGRTRAKNKG